MLGSSSTAMSSLTEDIWLEIFLHLPLKHMFKSKCVSKVWLHLLCNPYFVNKWIALNECTLPWTLFYGFLTPDDYLPDNPMKIMFGYAYLDLHSPFFSCHDGFSNSFEFLNPKPNCPKTCSAILLGSSNGLVLCRTDLSDENYYVCNPLTRKWVEIPLAPSKSSDFTKIGFVCELFSASSLVSSRYKVVRIPRLSTGSDSFLLQIFSSDSGEWSIHKVSCPQALTFHYCNYTSPVLHHGVLYLNIGENRMLVYDFDNSNAKAGGHQCQFINFPDCSYEGEGHVYGTELLYFTRRSIGVSEGLTFYAHIEERNNTLSVWVLEGEWQLLHENIELDDLLTEIDNKLKDPFHTEMLRCRRRPINLSSKLIQILGLSPVDKNVVMLGYNSFAWAYSIRTRRYEELCRPSFMPGIHFGGYFWMHTPFVFKPMPTILPTPSETDT